MTNKEVQIKAAKIVADQLKLDINSDIDFQKSFHDLGADSLDMVELVIKFEDAFKVVISDQDAVQIKNLHDVLNIVS